MSDYSELKRLAESFKDGMPDWDDLLGLGYADYEYAKAANPAVVLALIAESERIKARLCMCRDCGGHGEVYSGHSTYQGYNQPPEPEMDVCGTFGGDGVLGPVEDFEALAAERDQLKAEVEALHAKIDRLLAHCPEGECATCGEIICPHGGSMHFHHDGCPSCAEHEFIESKESGQ